MFGKCNKKNRFQNNKFHLFFVVLLCFYFFLSSNSFAKADLDKGQDTIMPKLKHYLEAYNGDKGIISRIKGRDNRYCGGYSALWLRSKWMQIQSELEDKNSQKESLGWLKYITSFVFNEEKEKKKRYDYMWFYSTVELIAGWDKSRRLSDEEREDFEYFASQVDFLQHAISYSVDLDRILEDENGKKPRKEYSISFLVTLEQLKEIFKTDNFIKDRKLIVVSSPSHITGLFRNGSYYYYFDPNSYTGEIKVFSTDKLAELVFEAMTFQNTREPHFLGFKIYSFDQKIISEYPPQQKILEKITQEQLSEYGENLFMMPDGESANRWKWTTLMMAAEQGCLESIRHYLKMGDDPNAQSRKGYTPLVRATQHDRLDVMKLLLENGADPNIKDMGGQTPLLFAVSNKSFDAVEMLLEEKANPDIQEDERRWTVLFVAAKEGALDILKLLLRAGAKPNIVGKNNETALMVAAFLGHLDIVKELLREGANPDIVEYAGRTALRLAEKEGHTEIAMVLRTWKGSDEL